MNDCYQSENEIEAVVRGFESCTTGKEQFKHRDHLTVAVWYLRNSTQALALEKMRAGLHRFLDFHEVDKNKYKESVTVAWIGLVHDVLVQLDPALSLVEVTNLVCQQLGDKRVVPERDEDSEE